MAKDGMETTTLAEQKKQAIKREKKERQPFFDKFFDLAGTELADVEKILDQGFEYYNWRVKALTVEGLYQDHKMAMFRDLNSKVGSLAERTRIFKDMLDAECKELGITIEELPKDHFLRNLWRQSNVRLDDALDVAKKYFCEEHHIPYDLYRVIIKYEDDLKEGKKPQVPDWEKLVSDAS